ncbi:MAG: hypothetical protein ACD_13C00052G0009 [uncultured bacterium]|uniref:Deoxyadenosine kinase n=1 Tax=Candidatus Woesebacteria bacterium GW2011_GWA1_40_43 TaxID=1618553 RepID=A0A0G0SLD2_9BACT|nr:MAG: hypothetical protein ACD_13C00052G0009 [uncultured bacterium]KKR54311.1 MAG: Deoxyadenosine kinase [Candidatus Woesebacteria bacterium GW2011_GWD2_40_19]KKR57524.1 MAG: Deoxyadenosine kinase [Candidatus Woesebacteria bacterium GW2011_GWC2_40_30]KKR63166.1 MAG: Deoxyadenosine kinase [Candidatus Woesebacteria bacterium GW2011_GWA1_40_43]HAU65618.1 hypothetical protein [Candidatus Woesebacteria bacterium]
MVESIEGKETLEKKPLVIGLVGCLASGKTTLSEELARRWGIEPIEENYPANPFLEKFYKDPKEYSFKSQVFFLSSKVEQLKSIDRSKVSLIDPELNMDFIYAKTHFKMGWMNENEWNLYQNIFFTITTKDSLVYPDMHIVVAADQEELKQRIIDRGRNYEMGILKNYPEYLERLSESVHEWGMKGENNSYKFIANTSAGGSSGNVEQLADRVESHICREFGTNGKFVLPKIKPALVVENYDIFPGSGGDVSRLRR